MKIINAPRRSGKTTKLIHLAHEHDAYIVVRSIRQALYMQRQALSMGIKISLPISYIEFIGGDFNPKFPILIDQADDLLQHLTGAEIIAITTTSSEDND
ncbi:MAG: hypothetical protein ACPGXY_03165 [Alphaproteobacteria bacterium]